MMIGALSYIVRELETPDDQGNNWYAWACNQLSHVCLGFAACGLAFSVGASLWFAVGFASALALSKEMHDLATHLSWKVAIDKAHDLTFMASGIALAVALWEHIAGIFLSAFGVVLLLLVLGVIPRAINAIKKMRRNVKKRKNFAFKKG